MASKKNSSMAFFLVLNLVLFTLATACSTCPGSIPKNPNFPGGPTCPRDTLKLGVCANLLHVLLGLTVGTPPKTPCCTLIEGLADLEAAVCLCTALKADVLGNKLNIRISLTLLLNVCSKKLPPGFTCA